MDCLLEKTIQYLYVGTICMLEPQLPPPRFRAPLERGDNLFEGWLAASESLTLRTGPSCFIIHTIVHEFVVN